MLQNARVIAFTISELLRENQQSGSKNIQTKIRAKIRIKLGIYLPLKILQSSCEKNTRNYN